MLRVSGREILREAFVQKVRDEMGDLGWALIEISDGFAIANIDVLSGWTLIASKRIGDEIRSAKDGSLSEQELMELISEDGDTADDKEEEEKGAE